MSIRRSHGPLVLAACLAAGPAAAAVPEPWGMYVGADMGMTDFRGHQAALDELLGVPAGSSSLDRNDLAYSLVVGFRFSKYFALETGWLAMGHSTYRPTAGDAGLNLGSSGLAATAIGTLPLSDTWSLEGRVGMYFNDTQVRGWLNVAIEIGSDGNDVYLEGEGGADPSGILGLGLVGSLDEHWTLRLGYEYFTDRAIDVRDTVGGDRLDTGAGRWLLGLRYRF